MNLARGLFRVWVVGSVIWTGYWLWDWVLICQFTFDPPERCLRPVPWEGLAIIVLLYPVLALLAGRVLIWMVRGFRR